MATNIQLTSRQKKIVLWLAMALMPISGMGIYLYLPALPTITQKFGIDHSLTQLSISTYLLGLGLPQIIFGIWSDQVGRRKLLMPALVLFPLITLAVPLSKDISMLLFLRFLQGAAISVSDVSIKAFMPDAFEKEELDKNANYLIIAWAIGPILAPLIGEFLLTKFGWRFPFYFLFLYSAICYVLCQFLLPETNPNPKKLNFKGIISTLLHILFNKAFLTAIACMIMLYTAVELFNTMGPFIMKDALNLSSGEFSRLALYLGIAWLIGNAANRFHAGRKNLDKVIMLRVILILIASLIMVLFALFNIVSYWVIALPLIVIIYSSGLIFPRIFSKALGMFPQSSGIVAALLGTLLTLGIAATTAIASFLPTETQFPMALYYLVITIAFAIIYWFGLHHHSK